jgi:hypothetical protein
MDAHCAAVPPTFVQEAGAVVVAVAVAVAKNIS